MNSFSPSEYIHAYLESRNNVIQENWIVTTNSLSPINESGDNRNLHLDVQSPNVISINDEGGRSPHPTIALDYPNIHIFILSSINEPQEGYKQAKMIRNCIHGLSGKQFYESEGEINLKSSGKNLDYLVSCVLNGDINKIGGTIFRNKTVYLMNYRLIFQSLDDEFRSQPF